MEVAGYRVERKGPGDPDYVQIGTPTTTSLGDSGLAASTSYSYRVRAADSAGNLGPYSAVAVGMTDAPDTAPPSVAISAPADGATVSHVVTISATASDNVGVSGVEFFADGVSLGTDTTAPYSVNWDSTTASNGLHALVAVASDADGNQATSAAVTVNAINPAFVNEVVVPDITAATTIAFLPDGRMLVGELTGHVWVVQAGANSPDPTPFLTIDYSLLFGEQGLMDIALDPNFAQNGYYYVFYTHGFSGQHNRDTLSRFTASGNSTVAGSELVLWQDDRDANGEHHGGAIAFGLDGKLYFTTGEHFDPPEAQDLTTFRGKVLRINSDGTVPTDNPFYDGAGPNKDAIWAYGLRNPYRMSIDPVTGVMYIGDVGGNDPNTAIEELDIGARGANYGWPLEEGDGGVPGTTPPIYSYPHNGRDAAITGGFVYRGTQFPSEYYGSYFFGDYVQNTLKRLTFDANGNVSNVVNFWPSDGTPDTTAVGDPVKILQGPDGSLYYVDIGFNDQHVPNEAGIHRISYSITNQPPVAVDSATPQSGQPPLEVSFSSAGSYDPEGATLTYSWNFGDGTTSTEANPTHTYTAAGHYVVLLSVSDGTASDLASDLDITVGTPPVPTILTPSDGSIFRAGDVIDYSGSATDAEDGTLSASAFSWTILFHHDTHIHPAGGPFDGTTSGSLTIPTTGHDFQDTTYYEIILTVTDSTGLSTSTSVLLYPDKVNVSFDSIPSGLSLSVDGIVKQTPFVVDDIIGFQHTIAAETQISGTSTYDFLSWSDGGAASHTVVVPSSDQSFTVTFGLHELDLNGAAAGTSYTSSWTGFAAIAVAIVDAAEATLDNPAGTNLTQLTAALTSPHTGDSLSANNSAAPGIAVSFAGGTLTLSGSDTLANYQAVLRTIKYTNTAGGPLVDSLYDQSAGVRRLAVEQRGGGHGHVPADPRSQRRRRRHGQHGRLVQQRTGADHRHGGCHDHGPLGPGEPHRHHRRRVDLPHGRRAERAQRVRHLGHFAKLLGRHAVAVGQQLGGQLSEAAAAAQLRQYFRRPGRQLVHRQRHRHRRGAHQRSGDGHDQLDRPHGRSAGQPPVLQRLEVRQQPHGHRAGQRRPGDRQRQDRLQRLRHGHVCQRVELQQRHYGRDGGFAKRHRRAWQHFAR